MDIKLNDVEVFFLRRALEWRIQNIDYFIQKKNLEGLKKANQLSEKATLMGILEMLGEPKAEDDGTDESAVEPVATVENTEEGA